MINNITVVLYPVLFTLLTGFVGYAAKEGVKLIPHVVTLIVAKIGAVNYNKAKIVAVDTYKAVNENNRLGLLVNSKADEFETLIKTKLPNISVSDIALLRQSIADDYNSGKAAVVKELDPIVNTVIPTVTYKDENGNELVKKIVEAIV